MTNAMPEAVIDPPVTPDERVRDAIAAFGLVCDLAIEALEQSLYRLDTTENVA
jgi:hypothetical protein